ncbi:predicted protein [Chaetoceros tenuissimus]|uniref:Uncharacterized protein n=1 Tax=Chaetoceros tenuissimus TaxID=426638 RepID=A0AAD3HFZ3_9STRA|nr:predicted protein [Chaetoceros tenuissimus]
MSDEDCPALVDRGNSSRSDYDDSSDEDSYSCGSSSAEDSIPGLAPNNRRGNASNMNENQNLYNHPPIPQAQFRSNDFGSEGDSSDGPPTNDDNRGNDDSSSDSDSSGSMPNLMNRIPESSDDSESSEDDIRPRRRIYPSDSSDDDSSYYGGMPGLQQRHNSSDSDSMPVSRLQRVRVRVREMLSRIDNPSSRREEDQQEYRRETLASHREEALMGELHQNRNPPPRLNPNFGIPILMNPHFDDSTYSASSIDSDFDVEVEPLLDYELEFRKMSIYMMIDNGFWGNVDTLIDDLKKNTMKEHDSFEVAVKTWKGREVLLETLKDVLTSERVLDNEQENEKRENDIMNFVACYEEAAEEIESLEGDSDSDDSSNIDEEELAENKILQSNKVDLSSSDGCKDIISSNKEHKPKLFELLETRHCTQMKSIGDCLANILLLQKKIAPVEQALQEPDPSPYCQMVSKVILVWIFEGNCRARITHLMEKLLQTNFEFEYKMKDEILQNLQVLESYLSQDVLQNCAALTIDEMDQQA